MKNNTKDKVKFSDIELVIISYNSKKHFDDFFNSIPKHIIKELKFTLVDNNSKDESVKYLKTNFDFVNVIDLKENKGYGAAANIGWEQSERKHILICNTDLIFFEDTFNKLIKSIEENHNYGVIGGNQQNIDGSPQWSYWLYPSLFLAFSRALILAKIYSKMIKNNSKKRVLKQNFINGAFYLVRRDVLKKTNGFDEDFFFYSEEADLCKRIKNLNLPIIFDPVIKLVHLGGGSVGSSYSDFSAINLAKGKWLFAKKHLSFINRNILYFLEVIAEIWDLIFGLIQLNSKKIRFHWLSIKTWVSLILKSYKS